MRTKREKNSINPLIEDNLLDHESRKRLPPLFSGEGQGLDEIVQIKFFTLDAQST